MRGVIIALAAWSLIPGLSAGQPSAAEPYLLLGIDAALSSDPESARRFLGAAIEIDPSGSDAPYYLARVNVENDVHAAIALLGRAVSNDRWVRASLVTARLDLAALLVRVGRYRDALATLDSLKTADSLRVEPYRLTALAWLGQGEREAALSAVEAGLTRHPADGTLHVLRAQALTSGGFPVRGLLDLAAIVAPGDTRVGVERALAALAEGGSPLPAALMPATPDPRLFAEIFAAAPDEAALGRFFASGGNQRVDLLEKVAAAARSPGLAERFAAGVSGFGGTRWVDENADGIPEETYRYENGSLVSWERDANEDGVSEASFAAGSLRVAGTVYTFAPYPFLAKVSLSRLATQWTFELPPRRVRGPFLEGLESAAAARVRGPVGVPSEATLAQAARAVRETTAGGPRRTWAIEAGVPTALAEDVDGDDRPDYVVAFRSGAPATAQRDVDRDGAWDIVETWSSGGLRRLQVDLNHNGVAEYTVDFEKRVWLWDYDEDGKPERSAAAPAGGPKPDALWPAVIPRRGVGE